MTSRVLANRVSLVSVFLVVLTAATAPGQARDERTTYPLIFRAPDETGELAKLIDPTDATTWTCHPGGELELTGSGAYRPKVRSPRSIAWLKHPAVGSFVLELEMKQTGRDYGHRDLCLFFGRQSACRFYYVHLATKADPNAHNVFLVNDAPRKSFATRTTQGVDWGRDVYRKVRLERDVLTGSIRVFFEDMTASVMEASDKTFGVGRIGFGSFDDTGRFRRIRLYAPRAWVTDPDVEIRSASATLMGPLLALTSSPDERWRLERGSVAADLSATRPIWGHVADYDALQALDTGRAFDHLYAPESGIRLTKGAREGPFPHHRGVMAGWMRTRVAPEKWFDFWHLGKVTIRHHEWLPEAMKEEDGVFHVGYRSLWHDPEGRAVVAEERRIAIRDLTGVGVPARRFDYLVQLTSLTGESIHLAGDPQHAGLQIRMAKEIADRRKETVYLRPQRAASQGNDVWEQCGWVAGRFTVQRKTFWVLHVSSKELPEPLVYSTRDYGRFGCYFPTDLPAEGASTFPFTIVVMEGEVPAEHVAKLAASIRNP